MANMLTTFFLDVIYWVVNLFTWPIQQFENVTVNSGVGAAIADATHYLASFNSFLPISTLAVIIGLVVGIETILATYKLVMWLIRRLPTQS